MLHTFMHDCRKKNYLIDDEILHVRRADVDGHWTFI